MEKKDEDNAIKSIDLNNMPRNDFDMDDLKMLWRRYAFMKKDEGKLTTYNALIKRDPKLKKDQIYVLEVDSQAQIDYINTTDLVSFIRKGLKNYEMNIVIELTKNQGEEVKFQTGKDRFAALARKNPNLHSLKNTFNLDIEY